MPDAIEEHSPSARSVTCSRAFVHVWLLPLDAWRSRSQELEPVVDPAQRRRCNALREPALRRDRLLAHALHRVLVAEALGLSPYCLPLYRSHTGQPRIALPGLHTSLSHADGMVAVALAPCAVGVDVEARQLAPLSPIADLVCTPAELAALPGDPDQQQQRLLSTWVGKEAVLKAAGVGLARQMSSFNLEKDAPVEINATCGRNLRLHVHRHDEGSAWVFAVASETLAPPHWSWRLPPHHGIESI